MNETTTVAPMMIYGYEYQAKYTNATITISVRTDEGQEVADRIAKEEFDNAMEVHKDSWYLAESWDEEF